MKKPISISSFIAASLFVAASAGAQPAEPPADGGAAATGAANPSELYLPGPGGGDDFKGNGPPPLESTGLEGGGGDGGCKCDLAPGASRVGFSSAFGLAMAFAFVARRRARRGDA